MLSSDLRWFVVLAAEGQVTAAADELRLSQPTLSRRLAALERRLGVELFDRHGRRLTLNRYGRLLHEHAGRALDELVTAEDRITELSSPSTGTVRLDFLHSFGPWLVPDLIRAFRADAPGVRFTLHQDAAGRLADRVLDGHSDLAVISPRPREPDLDWMLLDRQPLALAVPADHALADRTEIGLDEAANERFVAMHPDFGMRSLLDEAAEHAGFTPEIVFESSELATVTGLVSAGLGVALVPVREAAPWPVGVAVVPVRDAAAVREVGMVWSRARTLTAPAARFRDFVADDRKPRGR
ncbi:LysR family transcriptional regulator [Rhodococcus sp. NPDC059234]|uniref:LysR family transcriptional regulator n=1 Tax=Rhodococcus sp. NPDC059234 TaxID=3346781 RepID=UPI00366E7597